MPGSGSAISLSLPDPTLWKIVDASQAADGIDETLAEGSDSLHAGGMKPDVPDGLC
jgi:hypothetical protein